MEEKKFPSIKTSIKRSGKKKGPSKLRILYMFFASVLFLLALALLYTFLAKHEMTFDPIEALSYETLTMQNDLEHGSLDLLTSNPQELADFFAKQKNIEFSPFILQPPLTWTLHGGSFINYDDVLITVACFQRMDSKDTIFQYAFAGHLEDLPKGLSLTNSHYRLYTSDSIRMVVWQNSQNTLAMLASSLEHDQLVNFAASYLKK